MFAKFSLAKFEIKGRQIHFWSHLLTKLSGYVLGVSWISTWFPQTKWTWLLFITTTSKLTLINLPCRLASWEYRKKNQCLASLLKMHWKYIMNGLILVFNRVRNGCKTMQHKSVKIKRFIDRSVEGIKQHTKSPLTVFFWFSLNPKFPVASFERFDVISNIEKLWFHRSTCFEMTKTYVEVGHSSCTW